MSSPNGTMHGLHEPEPPVKGLVKTTTGVVRLLAD